MVANSDDTTAWRLDKARHVKYWTRCLKTYLPSQYTSNDSNRMYLAYLILSSLELLDVLDSLLTREERAGYIKWIYRCQHPGGGFRMWPGTDFGDRSTTENARWDPAHVPATYFALTSLLTLGDDLSRVDRESAIRWLATMQRADGSFGETIVDGRIEGGSDPRFGYCATGSRFILLGHSHQLDVSTHDFDVLGFADSIKRSQSYDGGLADTAFSEPHAGYTFCALGALAFTGQLPAEEKDEELKHSINKNAVIRWLVDRQTDLVDPDASSDSEFLIHLPGKTALGSGLDKPIDSEILTHSEEPPSQSISGATETNPAAGMNGRLNKVADTCYCWWVAASLTILGQHHLYNRPSLRRYLLELTQNPFMGGFCKFPDDKYADIYHSYMGLAALSLCSTAEQRFTDGISAWDAEMCISMKAKRRIVPWKSIP